jgi:hypothetical protein
LGGGHQHACHKVEAEGGGIGIVEGQHKQLHWQYIGAGGRAGGGGNVDNIFDAMLMQAAGNRNKLNMERDRHREEEEKLGRNINALATKLRQREEELELLRAEASS